MTPLLHLNMGDKSAPPQVRCGKNHILTIFIRMKLYGQLMAQSVIGF